MPEHDEAQVAGDPLWYKDAIIYELHIRAFADSDGDGIGDFRGLAQKLDYLQDLGVTAIWVLPFYPSPLKDDGYDIADYTGVNPMYGDLKDVRLFIKEAHKRGLKVITELVCNHTSDQHPWFQRARRAPPGSSHRNFYVWSDTPERYQETRIIFKDFEPSNWSWDPVANAYFWHRFYSHQPDLNFDNPAVHRAIFQALDFWMKMGVDGLRLDAIPYLYERDGTSNENLPETHQFLKQLRRYIDERYQNRMLLSEANQWPEDVVHYFGDGDECHMNFHFPLMPRLFMSIQMESRYPIIDILNQTPQIPDTAQWALFLRNHDELTLEMVTDEERDYMYRVYADDKRARINLGIRRRLAPLLQNNRRRIELMNGLLFSLPGTPVLYYGDEIGMGDNIYLGDRNGVRTPMQWGPDRNAGFSQANRQQLYLPVITDPEYHYEAVNVATQQQNPSSLLWWMKRLIALRKRYRAFGRGTIEFLHPENRRVLAFVRRYEDECILVVANLSRFVQGAELDLAEFRGHAPVELFGRVPFPPITDDRPYFITLGPHEFFWFALEPAPTDVARAERGDLPALAAAGEWETALAADARRSAEVLADYVRARPWFQGAGRRARGAQVAEVLPLPGTQARLALLRLDYAEGDPELYALPLAWASGAAAELLRHEGAPHSLVAELRAGGRDGLLYDALYDPAVVRALVAAISGRRRQPGGRGALVGAALRGLRRAPGSDERVTYHEHENTTIVVGERLVIKVFRRLDEGLNPQVELGLALAEGGRFSHAAPLLGYLEYQRERDDPLTLAALHAFVPNEGDARGRTLDALGTYLEQAVAVETQQSPPAAPPLGSAVAEIPGAAFDLLGAFLETARLLGRRTAEMHAALASVERPEFAPEAYTPFYQRSAYQGMRAQLSEALAALRRELPKLPEEAREAAEQLLARERALHELLRPMVARTFSGMRTRVHGDYRLEQLLLAGGEAVVLDFEGDTGRSISERRIKRSPLRDVARLLGSIGGTAATALSDRSAEGGVHRPEDQALLMPRARAWVRWAAAALLSEYLRSTPGAAFLPRTSDEVETLLRCILIEQTASELARALREQPERAAAEVRALLELAGE
jgi:maltose alpha-D-glucosyltransferase / alpha-amylase